MNSTNYGELIGIEHLEAPADHALLEIKIRPELCNRLGYIHGGLLMSIMDVAGCWAAVPWDSPTGSASTVSFTCNFLRSAKADDFTSLYAYAELIKKGRSLYFSAVHVRAGREGPVLASGQGVYSQKDRPA